MPSHQEIELKLIGEPSELSAFFEDLEGDGPVSSWLVSTYYDTDESRLWSKGYALRLRARGDAFELTLKQERGDPLTRGEWTSRLSEPTVDIGLLPDEAPRGDIGVILPEELRPRFTSEIERRRKKLAPNGAVVEASLDIGRIVGRQRAAPIAELEFELLSGSTAGLLHHVRSLLGRHRIAVGTRSKAARGMALADDVPPACVTAAKPGLHPSDTVGQAVTTILAEVVAHIVGNLAAAADGRDPEGVHQLRVALRRLRSLFALFEDRLVPRAGVLDQAAKTALKTLGPARDLDVFLFETMPPVVGDGNDQPGISKLVDVAEARKHDAYARVRRLIGEPNFNRFLLDLMLVAQDGGKLVGKRTELMRPAAAALLQRRHKKALKVGKNFAELDPGQRHQVRIALKKLRYACNYFQNLFPDKPTRAYTKRLARLQDDLGKVNDASVAQYIVDQLAGGDAEAALGAALVKGWYRHSLHSVEPHMLGAWKRFAAAHPFWRLDT